MKVLDLFCGKGGWSIPFIEGGAHVVGVDIVDLGYPGHLILEDIRNLDGHRFTDYDLIIGSPPCTYFSVAFQFQVNRGKVRDIRQGLSLIEEFQRVVRESKPRFWVMENVENLKKWYDVPPIWKFKISRGGRRLLWGNLPIPLAPEFKFQRSLWKDYSPSADRSNKRAEIPYPIARFIADCVKQQIEVLA